MVLVSLLCLRCACVTFVTSFVTPLVLIHHSFFQSFLFSHFPFRFRPSFKSFFRFFFFFFIHLFYTSSYFRIVFYIPRIQCFLSFFESFHFICCLPLFRFDRHMLTFFKLLYRCFVSLSYVSPLPPLSGCLIALFHLKFTEWGLACGYVSYFQRTRAKIVSEL